MANCAECKSFFPIPESEDDFEQGKGDCIREEKDPKGKFWLSKPVMSDMPADNCKYFTKKLAN
ncbi:benzylsuccinate synthase gamma subunit family protein [Desulfoscipio gibsoniae]|uniref:BssC/TutF protein n=1 Tax=Desulfoscipio gibsoniae DSM 7213 TaxID=767817 RepID=R4KAJ4_9FIRM|nr:benzylsuccinate synthase gamma subunit family protein [Desulfoscipio gibsoniae]AGL00213.1 BssC/TutF protein [Desulfoscipio gibsoniae DSM 7213]